MRQALEDFLRRANIDAHMCVDGLEAVETFKKYRPVFDGALLDVTMPGMSGIEATQAIRALAPDLPIILMSGYAELSFDTVQPTAILLKPFPMSQLLALIDQHITAREACDPSPG